MEWNRTNEILHKIYLLATLKTAPGGDSWFDIAGNGQYYNA